MTTALDRLRCRIGWWLLRIAAAVIPDGSGAMDGFVSAGQALLDGMKEPS